MLRFKKILVPIDFSKEAEMAIEWAIKLAKQENNASLYLLHVIPRLPIVPESGIEIGRLIEIEAEAAKKKLDYWMEKVPSELSGKTVFAIGDLAEEVKTLCDKENIDLVVMTTHGRHGLSRLVHPNVTENVVRDAPCPVLVLHLNRKMQELAHA